MNNTKIQINRGGLIIISITSNNRCFRTEWYRRIRWGRILTPFTKNLHSISPTKLTTITWLKSRSLRKSKATSKSFWKQEKYLTFLSSKTKVKIRWGNRNSSPKTIWCKKTFKCSKWIICQTRVGKCSRYSQRNTFSKLSASSRWASSLHKLFRP